MMNQCNSLDKFVTLILSMLSGRIIILGTLVQKIANMTKYDSTMLKGNLLNKLVTLVSAVQIFWLKPNIHVYE